MSLYYCPFCNPEYQFHKTKNDGVLICGQCGDQLIKKPILNSRQIISFIAASAFLTPLLIMFIFIIKDFNKNEVQDDSVSLIFLPNKLTNEKS